MVLPVRLYCPQTAHDQQDIAARLELLLHETETYRSTVTVSICVIHCLVFRR